MYLKGGEGVTRRLPRVHLVPVLIILLLLFAGFSLQPHGAQAQPVAQAEIPHPIEGRSDCLACHKAGGAAKAPPATHASYTNSMCTSCHKLAAAAAQPTQAPAQATQAPAQPTQAPAQPTAAPAATGPASIPHTLDGRQDCLLCHKAGGAATAPPASHASYTSSMCLNCHKVAAATQPAAQPTAAPVAPVQPTATRPPAAPGAPSLIPHSLEGRSACLTCHGVAGLHPYPQSHAGRPESGCLTCHVPAAAPNAPTTGASTLPAGVQTCLSCHKQTDLSMTLSSGQKLSLFVDGEVFLKSMHGARGLECTACHPTNNVYPHPAIKAATERELNRGIVQQACASCHQTEYAQYKDSVHGKALLQDNNLDVPSCTDCHGTHNIANPTTKLFRADSPDLCSTCHANSKLMGKYGISANVTKTYFNDFHGTTIRLQSEQHPPDITAYQAVCYDCHGIHDIKMVNDPSSTVVKANLVKTCQKCHPNADTNFPTAWTAHYEPNLQKWPLVYFVNIFYKILIPLTIGGMVVFVGLDMTRSFINKRKSRRSK
jgi:predicted CXXCH cytochrome family protein